MESCLNVLGQLVADPLARQSSHFFSHVAVVLSASLVMEAVPGDFNEDGTYVPELGTWSGLEYEAGARLQLLPDLLLPAERSRF